MKLSECNHVIILLILDATILSNIFRHKLDFECFSAGLLVESFFVDYAQRRAILVLPSIKSEPLLP